MVRNASKLEEIGQADMVARPKPKALLQLIADTFADTRRLDFKAVYAYHGDPSTRLVHRGELCGVAGTDLG